MWTCFGLRGLGVTLLRTVVVCSNIVWWAGRCRWCVRVPFLFTVCRLCVSGSSLVQSMPRANRLVMGSVNLVCVNSVFRL